MKRAKQVLLKLYDGFISGLITARKWLELRLRYRLRIMSSTRTLRRIRRNGCSVARFGDGEMAFVLKNRFNIAFQNQTPELSEALRDVLRSKNRKLLLCVPRYLNSMAGCTRKCARSWWSWGQIDDNHKRIVSLIRELSGRHYCFGDTQITRPYMDTGNIPRAKKIFRQLKLLWQDRDILIVEGTHTRLGVGNDLFANARSIRRILAPAVGAFDCCADLQKAVTEHHNGALILLALGPTATVLASRFADQGLQALDVGHVDIEYEWFLHRATEKVAIQNKFTNEVAEGRVLSDCDDETYLSQVIMKVE